MEEQELKKIWQAYDDKLQKALDLNQRLVETINADRVESKLAAFRRSHVSVMVLGIVWVLFLVFLWANTLDNIYFTVSVGGIILFNVYAVAAYIWHLQILSTVSVAESITDTQNKLARVQVSLSNVGRTLFLQAPLYCTFWYSDEAVAHAGPLFWGIQAVVVSFFVFLSVFLYRNVTYKNMHKKWVRNLMDSFGGKKLRLAAEFMHEIEDFKKA